MAAGLIARQTALTCLTLLLEQLTNLGENVSKYSGDNADSIGLKIVGQFIKFSLIISM